MTDEHVIKRLLIALLLSCIALVILFGWATIHAVSQIEAKILPDWFLTSVHIGIGFVEFLFAVVLSAVIIVIPFLNISARLDDFQRKHREMQRSIKDIFNQINKRKPAIIIVGLFLITLENVFTDQVFDEHHRAQKIIVEAVLSFLLIAGNELFDRKSRKSMIAGGVSWVIGISLLPIVFVATNWGHLDKAVNDLIALGPTALVILVALIILSCVAPFAFGRVA